MPENLLKRISSSRRDKNLALEAKSTLLHKIQLIKEKETKVMMRKKQSRKQGQDKQDRLSALPDDVLIHILGFMDTIFAVRTCVLSKRWIDLWKHVNDLFFNSSIFKEAVNHEKFVLEFLSLRDDSLPLSNMHYDILQKGSQLRRVVRYAISHNVQHVKIIVGYFAIGLLPRHFAPLFSCQTLSSLDLNIGHYDFSLELPMSLQLPALKILSLSRLRLPASDNGYVKPFSNLNSLETLSINRCSLANDAKSLCISNLNLSCLKLRYFCHQYKVVLSTPSLCSLKVEEFSSLGCQELSSTCNLSSLAEVNIDISYRSYSVIIGWLQVFANVKKLTISSRFLRAILNDLSDLNQIRSQPPCFARLESLKVEMNPYTQISVEEVRRTTKYLLQNSPLRRVVVKN